ncbi:MAG: hypothetical protein VCE91_10020 [Nitrospinota bacterium]
MLTDSHIHSTVSDGSMEPHEIHAIAAGRGLQPVFITDHDNG